MKRTAAGRLRRANAAAATNTTPAGSRRPRASGAADGRQAVRRRQTGGKPAYHHGDLARAMLVEAVKTIQEHGIDALTLRAVGQQLGVSRTALYRHFANKDALLNAVATEGFRLLQRELRDAWTRGGEGQAGFAAMGAAYIGFALRHPSHYRVMFGSALSEINRPRPDPDGEGDAFGTLLNAVMTLQREGRMRADDPRLVSMYIWSVVHGVAMLALDGALPAAALEPLTRYAIDRISTSLVAGG